MEYVFYACLIYMILHTKSLYFGLISAANITLSIPLSMCIYRYIFGITYFSSIHLSIIIIVIGIGSDDIFVFHDFWQSNFKITALRHASILRLSYTFRMAVKTMFVTSVTSAVMFGSCVWSDIMPIRSFGWFASLVVVLVFLQTLIVQPFFYFLHERLWMNCLPCYPDFRRQLNFSSEPFPLEP